MSTKEIHDLSLPIGGPISDPTKAQEPQHFVFALVEDFSHMAFSCAVDPPRIADLISGCDLYSWSFASLDGETATSSKTSVTLTHHGFQEIPACERLFVMSGINMQRMDPSWAERRIRFRNAANSLRRHSKIPREYVTPC